MNQTVGATLVDFRSSPLGFRAGDANVYRYVDNNPVNLLDPTGEEGVGHHWVSVSILTDPAIRKRLSDGAFEVGMGAYSGPTHPKHCFGTYGGVSHKQYNDLVRKNLNKYMEANGISKMSQEDMERFIKQIREGRDHKGKIDPELKSFNDGIRAQSDAYLKLPRNRGFRDAESLEVWRKRGQSYLKGPRFFGTAVGAVLAGWASDALAGTTQALEVASESQHFRRGIGHLADGDMHSAEREFFGNSDENNLGGFMKDLINKGLAKPAMLFEQEYYKAKQRAQENVNRCT